MAGRSHKGVTAQFRARKHRQKLSAAKPIYALVDARDGLKSRLSGIYCGESIERHHIKPRSLCGETTTANVISLTPYEHRQVHAGVLKIVCANSAAGADGEVWFYRRGKYASSDDGWADVTP
jgi:hypothetical protein